MARYTKKRRLKKTKKRIKKRLKKTYRRKRLTKGNLRGGAAATQTSQPAFETDTEYNDKLKGLSKRELLNEHNKIMKELETFKLPEDPDIVVERINQYLNIELEKAKTEEEKRYTEQKMIAVEMSKPLYVYEIMTSNQKNREKIKNAFTGLFKKAISLTATIFTGPLGGIIVGSVSELLVRITGKLYEHMNAKSVSMNSARSSSQEVSTLEDHRVLMSLMVNMFMPNYSWLKKTLFLKLCHFWVMGGVLINDMWWARLPVDNPPGGESDPRFKPSTAEKEFYDRLWLLCKTFIGLGGQEWNEMIKEIQTEMGAGSYELVMAKMEETLGDEEDIKSLKSVLGEAFVKELLNLVSSEIGEIGEVGDLFKDLNEDIKSILPSGADVSKLTENAKELYDNVLESKPCSEDDVNCPAGTIVKTKKGSEGTITGIVEMEPAFKQQIDKLYEDGEFNSSPEYVSFDPEAIPEYTKGGFESNINPKNGKYVFKYGSDELKKDDMRERLMEYTENKMKGVL
tara:strand:- start:241 stop:1776 length:1536 start_codon:yes stop_codon:yes gene_type:complete